MYQHVEDADRRTYLGMVTAMDDAVGNITQTLVDSGLYDNSVILWFSDNGGPAANWPPGITILKLAKVILMFVLLRSHHILRSKQLASERVQVHHV